MLLFLSLLSGCSGTGENDGTTFLETLDEETRGAVLWYCDYEDRSFRKWEDQGTDDYNAGGGIFLTDEQNVDYGISDQLSHSGSYGSFASIKNATSPGENKAVRFMRWTDKAWDEGGGYFPEAAYYSVFLLFPEIYDPSKPAENDPFNDGGWWNVFQFKSDNNAGSQPVVVLDLYNENGTMFWGLVIKDYPDDNSEDHTDEYILQSDPAEITANRWIHVEACLKKSSHYDGEVRIWQDGTEIFHKTFIRTMLPPAETTVWGIGNYTDYIAGGSATVYFDDAIVSTRPISEFLNQ